MNLIELAEKFRAKVEAIEAKADDAMAKALKAEKDAADAMTEAKKK